MTEMESERVLPLAVVLAAVTVAAITDLWSLRIHNGITLPLFLTGILYHWLAGGMEGFAGSLLGVLVGVGPLIPLYARGGMGAGDVKMLAGLGAWLGAWYVLHIVILAGLATGIYAQTIVMWNWFHRVSKHDVDGSLVHDCRSNARQEPHVDVSIVAMSYDARQRVVPFGVMLALGVIGAIMWLGV